MATGGEQVAGPIPIRVDVGDAAGVPGPAEQAAWVFVPPGGRLTDPVTVLVCEPGGTYDKRYWHLEVPGHPGYSFAEDLAARGAVVIALDHLGVGESTVLDPPTLTSTAVAAADHHAVAEVRRRLAQGDLAPGLDPAPDPFVVGVGHSMGGMLVVRQQGRHRSFDAVAVLGWSNLGLEVHGGDDAVVSRFAGLTEEALAERWREFGDPTTIGNRAGLHGLFYLDDVPQAVLDADAAAEATLPGIAGYAAALPGVAAADAAAIEVPVLVGFGAVDTSPDPHAEVACYRSSRLVTLHVLAGAAHCTNLAATRHELWDVLHDWATGLARRARAGR
jgi:alpha-beta hydrolase superfamily lysophospholipase